MSCAKKITAKKQNTEDIEEIQNYLRRKGYKEENIREATIEKNREMHQN